MNEPEEFSEANDNQTSKKILELEVRKELNDCNDSVKNQKRKVSKLKSRQNSKDKKY